MIETLLLELGLSEKEIKVYLEITKKESITATEIARKTKLHRPTIYDIIEKLIGKGLITQVVKAKKKSFQPTDFTKFISKIKEKEQLAYLAIQELNKLHKPSTKDYKIEVFEGVEGLKSYFDYVLYLLKQKQLKDYLVLGSTLNSIKNIKFFVISRMKDSISLIKNVDFRIIWNHDSNYEELRKSFGLIAKNKSLPEDVKTNCTTVIFNDYVSLFFTTNKPIIVRIYSKNVADTYRSHFSLLWRLIRN